MKWCWFHTLGINRLIGVSNHLLRIVSKFLYHSQKVIGSLGIGISNQNFFRTKSTNRELWVYVGGVYILASNKHMFKELIVVRSPTSLGSYSGWFMIHSYCSSAISWKGEGRDLHRISQPLDMLQVLACTVSMKYSSISNLHPCKAFWGDLWVNTYPSIFQIHSAHQHMHVVCWCFFSVLTLQKKGWNTLTRKSKNDDLKNSQTVFTVESKRIILKGSNPESCRATLRCSEFKTYGCFQK